MQSGETKGSNENQLPHVTVIHDGENDDAHALKFMGHLPAATTIFAGFGIQKIRYTTGNAENFQEKERDHRIQMTQTLAPNATTKPGPLTNDEVCDEFVTRTLTESKEPESILYTASFSSLAEVFSQAERGSLANKTFFTYGSRNLSWAMRRLAKEKSEDTRTHARNKQALEKEIKKNKSTIATLKTSLNVAQGQEVDLIQTQLQENQTKTKQLEKNLKHIINNLNRAYSLQYKHFFENVKKSGAELYLTEAFKFLGSNNKVGPQTTPLSYDLATRHYNGEAGLALASYCDVANDGVRPGQVNKLVDFFDKVVTENPKHDYLPDLKTALITLINACQQSQEGNLAILEEKGDDVITQYSKDTLRSAMNQQFVNPQYDKVIRALTEVTTCLTNYFGYKDEDLIKNGVMRARSIYSGAAGKARSLIADQIPALLLEEHLHGVSNGLAQYFLPTTFAGFSKQGYPDYQDKSDGETDSLFYADLTNIADEDEREALRKKIFTYLDIRLAAHDILHPNIINEKEKQRLLAGEFGEKFIRAMEEVNFDFPPSVHDVVALIKQASPQADNASESDSEGNLPLQRALSTVTDQPDDAHKVPLNEGSVPEITETPLLQKTAFIKDQSDKESHPVNALAIGLLGGGASIATFATVVLAFSSVATTIAATGAVAALIVASAFGPWLLLAAGVSAAAVGAWHLLPKGCFPKNRSLFNQKGAGSEPINPEQSSPEEVTANPLTQTT